MAAFRVERNMIHPYIQALHFLFFESIGNSEEFDVKWYDVPDEWKLNCGTNAINIDIYKKENTEDVIQSYIFCNNRNYPDSRKRKRQLCQ